MAFKNAHHQPGRRFATGSNRSDHVLGAFGFVAHAVFFAFIGALSAYLWPENARALIVVTAGAASALFVLRGHQVGFSTTKESIAAIWNAWSPWGTPPAATLLLLLSAAAVHAGPADAVVRLPSHGGSGTVIATGDGWTLILSCSHCFAGKDRDRPIEIDMPHHAPGPPRKVGVQLLKAGYWKSVDLSLIKLNAGPVPYVTPIGPVSLQARDCWSVGFDELKMPAVCRPATIVDVRGGDVLTDARPWHGRSGGALIDKRTGYLVGVCSSYSGPRDHAEYRPGCHGVYVSLPTIRTFLSQAGVLKDEPRPIEDPFAAPFRRSVPLPAPAPRFSPAPGR
jgi:Trypsin-like peptidase domain